MTRWVLMAVFVVGFAAATPCHAQDAAPPVEQTAPADEPAENASTDHAPKNPGKRRGKKAEEALVLLVILPGALVLFLCPVGLALQCLVLGYGPQRGRGVLSAQEARLKTVVLGVANTGFLFLVASATERGAPGISGLAWALWLGMAFLGLHGIARGIGERVLSRSPVLPSEPLKPLALGWCILVAASAMPIVGWCMGIYWLIRGSGVSVVSLLARKQPVAVTPIR